MWNPVEGEGGKMPGLDVYLAMEFSLNSIWNLFGQPLHVHHDSVAVKMLCGILCIKHMQGVTS